MGAACFWHNGAARQPAVQTGCLLDKAAITSCFQTLESTLVLIKLSFSYSISAQVSTKKLAHELQSKLLTCWM